MLAINQLTNQVKEINEKLAEEWNKMFTFDDIKMMYDWGCFTDEQVMEFAPLCITEKSERNCRKVGK